MECIGDADLVRMQASPFDLAAFYVLRFHAAHTCLQRYLDSILVGLVLPGKAVVLQALGLGAFTRQSSNRIALHPARRPKCNFFRQPQSRCPFAMPAKEQTA